ncbi:MAG: hypothetical protein IJB06_06495 [Bacteroidales bacterium]|nr:hypothetical protein [Bacteroidales bacterium]
MKKLIALIAYMLTLTSCLESIFDRNVPQVNTEKPSSPEEYGDFELQDNVIFIAEAYEDFIVEVIDSTAIVLRNEINEELYPQVGDIVYCMATKNSPYGFTGRIVSAEVKGNKTRFTTENINITDIFRELHMDMPVEMPDDISYMIDENGEKVECKVVSNDIWKEMEDSGANVETKVGFNNDISHTFEFGIRDTDIYEGHVYIGLGTSISVNISGGKLEKLLFSTTKRCGLVGSMKCSWDNTDDDKDKKKLLDKTIMLPFSIVAGPLILTPDFHVEAGLFFTAEATLQGDLSFELEHTRCEFGYINGEPTYETQNIATDGNRVFALTKFEAKGEAGIYAETGLELALYTRHMLALGASAKASFGLSVEGEISFGNEDLFQVNPKITVGPELTTGVYCFSELLKAAGNDTKFGFFTNHKLAKFELPIFPKFMNFVSEKINGIFSASAEVDKTNLVKTEEEGFALFKKDDKNTPLEHKIMEIRATKAVSQGSASFDVSNPDDHIIMPYVKADGKYWYLDEDDRWVDLGLSVLWAKYNVGATSPEEYGGYYAWGETEEKSSYSCENYKYYNSSTDSFINIGDDISGTQYDVAHVKWGAGARMPRLAEIKELLNNCSWSGSTYNGVKGMTVKGQNGNSIFLPFAGEYYDDYLEDRGEYGAYWSGTRDSGTGAIDFGAWCDNDDSDSVNWDASEFGYGHSVRPVKDK